MDKKPRSDKGIKRVAHSGYDRIYTFKLNAMIEGNAVVAMDTLIAQHGSIKEAMRFLLTGDSQPVTINTQSVDEKLNRIMAAIEALGTGSKGGKVTSKQKATVIDAVKDYCTSLSDFMS
jgi:hypothetical protein